MSYPAKAKQVTIRLKLPEDITAAMLKTVLHEFAHDLYGFHIVNGSSIPVELPRSKDGRITRAVIGRAVFK